MFNRFKQGQNNAVRLFYKKLQEKEPIKRANLMAWLRRNYPEAFRGEK